MLENNADISATDIDGRTALHLASEWGQQEVVLTLLEAKADVSAKATNGDMPLHSAADYGHCEVVSILLAAKADINAQAADGTTALKLAASFDNREVVKVLLEAKADISILDDEGWSALHSAAWYGHWQVIALLLKAYGQGQVTQTGDTPTSLPANSQIESIESLAVFESLISLHPNDAIFHRSLANEYLRNKKYPEAKASFDKSILTLLDPNTSTDLTSLELGVDCDLCDERIQGCQYKCTQCHWNYDVCDGCYDEWTHPHSSEDIFSIPSWKKDQ